MTTLFTVVVIAGVLATGWLGWWAWTAILAIIHASARNIGRPHDRADLLDVLEAIDAEILDLYDERADVAQALRKLDTTGRA